MARFRKKPIEIEAFRLSYKRETWPDWAYHRWHDGDLFLNADESATIKTLEGDLRAEMGDWIIKGVEGEIYPCKPSIFEATYEPVDD